MSSKGSADRKGYAQMCPMANALDVIGDRWTPLILRELLGGPARFSELQEGLPGIAKNLLTERLRRLEHDGILQRLTGEAAGRYALTEAGMSVRPTLEALAFWGAKIPRVVPPIHPRSIRATAMALQAIVCRAAESLAEVHGVVEVESGVQHLEFSLGPRPTVTVRKASNPDSRVLVSDGTFSHFLQGKPLNAESFVLVSGSEEGRQALLQALGLGPA